MTERIRESAARPFSIAITSDVTLDRRLQVTLQSDTMFRAARPESSPLKLYHSSDEEVKFDPREVLVRS